MKVVSLGAVCELERESALQVDLHVSEFAVLEDGTEIRLHSDRGWSAFGSSPADFWSFETAATLERTVRAVVLPDDAEATGEEHPWIWLRELLSDRGITTSEDELRSLPYEVRFGPAVARRVAGT